MILKWKEEAGGTRQPIADERISNSSHAGDLLINHDYYLYEPMEYNG
jgi:uncharacterized protein YaiI (UPF0178 family)